MIALLDIAATVFVQIWLNSFTHVLSAVGPQCLWGSAIMKSQPGLFLVLREAVAWVSSLSLNLALTMFS